MSHGVSGVKELANVGVIGLAEVIPVAGVRGDDVWLVAAVHDDVVGALDGAEELALKAPADVHEFDRGEGAATLPRGDGGVGAFASELVADGDGAEGGESSVADGEIIGDVSEEDGVDILEVACANVVGLRAEQLFGNAWPDLEGAGHVVLHHDVFDRQNGEDVERDAGVVAFPMTGSASDDGILVGDAGLLRGLRDAVDVRAKCDDGLAGAPRCHEGGGNAGDAAFDLEAVAFEEVGEILRTVELLVAEFRVAEHGVDHHLGEFGARLDAGNRVFFHAGEGGRVGGGLLGDCGCREQKRHKSVDAETRELADGHRFLRGFAGGPGFVGEAYGRSISVSSQTAAS